MTFLQQLFIRLLNMSITASYVILAVLFIRVFLKKAPKVYSYLLWLVVAFRLVCPVSFSSMLSIFNLSLFQMKEALTGNGNINYIPDNIAIMQKPNITVGILPADRILNENIPKATQYASINPMQVYLFLIVAIWVAGILVLTTYSILSYLKLKRRVARAVRYQKNVFECDSIGSPFVFGIVKPRIYLPFRLQERELDYILRHEQYHIKRRDYIIKPLAFLLLILYWFHPLVWIAYFCMTKDMEMSCDEKVLQEMGNDIKSDYSRSLLAFASNHRIFTASPLAFGETNTRKRITNILKYKKPKKWSTVLVGFLCIASLFLCAANPYQMEEKAAEAPAVEEGVTDFAHALYNSKNPYIGNASADGKLLQLLGVSELGDYTIELTTTKEPYVLKVVFKDEVFDRDSLDMTMIHNATLLLALIDNASEIHWSYPFEQDGQMTLITVYYSAENMAHLEYADIKSFASSAAKIQELLNMMEEPISVIKEAPDGTVKAIPVEGNSR
jgi:beta-lactamase regulating signal transducer with metallopeptidase domain